MGLIRVAVRSPSREQARGRIHGLAGAFAVFEGRNGLRRRRASGLGRSIPTRRMGRLLTLSVPELAQIAVPRRRPWPVSTAPARRRWRSLADAFTVRENARLADHPGVRRPVAIAPEDARHHLHRRRDRHRQVDAAREPGPAGCGGGTRGRRHRSQGDLVESILERLPEGCEDRTCVVDPDDRKDAVGLNVLAGSDPDLIVDHVAGVFKRIYEPWWGPRTDDIMRAVPDARADPGATLAEVPLLLTDFDWRRAIRERLADVGGLSAFWSWYERLPEQQRAQHIAPLLNKLRSFLLRGPVHAIVGQATPKRDIESLIDEGGLLLVRVPKGTLGEDTSRLSAPSSSRGSGSGACAGLDR